MAYVINIKLTRLLCVLSMIFLTGITLYSLLPEVQDNYLLIKYFNLKILPNVNYNSKWWYVAYWINNTLISPIIFILSYFILHHTTKLIIKGLSIFLLTLGIFQVLKLILEFETPVIWILYCLIYFIFLLIAYRYESKRLHEEG